MRTRPVWMLVLLFAAARPAAAQEVPFADLLAECLPRIGSETIPDNQEAQQRLQDACFALGTPGREAARAEACKLLSQKLGPETPRPARLWLLKQLQWIGRAECVEAVAALLADSDLLVREAALRALQSNPAAEANAKLVAALSSQSDPRWTKALLLALGYRQDPASVPALARQLSAQPDVAVAAIQGLGRIGNDQAAKTLSEAYGQARPELRQAMADAWLRCADRLVQSGKAEQAAAIYARLGAAGEPRPTRLAALKGQLQAVGEKALPMAIELVASGDRDAQSLGADYLGQCRDPNLAAAVSARLGELPAVSQATVLAILAARGDKSAMPLAIAAAGATDPAVRKAGIEALATLGDGTAVALLLERLQTGDELASAARDTLERIHGAGVDEALIAAMQGAAPAQRKGLIELLQKRGCAAAVPALLGEAQGQDKEICAAASRALGALAQPKDVPALVAILLKTPRGKDRDEAEKLVMFACSRGEDPKTQAQPVLAIFGQASADDRLALLSVLGRIGGDAALQVVRQAIQSQDEAVRDAGVRALCNWPDAGVADELLKLAAESPNKAHQTAALRAYVRVISQTGKEGDSKTLDKFRKAMQMATRDEDKKYLLSRVSNVRNVKTLRWVVSYLDDPVLATDASRAVVELAHRRELMEPNLREFSEALKRVVEVSKDAATVEKAKRIMQGL